MSKPVIAHERARLELQARLDAEKTQTERNKLGQFATPTGLAEAIIRHSAEKLGKKTKISFLDPAFGTGAFYSALIAHFAKSRVKRAAGYEVDPHYGVPARELWESTDLELRIADFTSLSLPAPSDRFNLIVCNPPYVRHHHLGVEEKQRLSIKTIETSGVRIGGLAGLYCYFMAVCHAWMSDGGVAAWLIPSEFMDVNYGAAVKQYLLAQVNLERIHRFDPSDVQFGDALVSSAVVWFRKEKPNGDGIRFTYGGTIDKPRHEAIVARTVLASEGKWTRFPLLAARAKSDFTLGDFFSVKRGVATGGNGFFILSSKRLAELGFSKKHFRPILPSPRDLPTNIVEADEAGEPQIENRRYLLNCTLSEDALQRAEPALYDYVMAAKDEFAGKYLCSRRNPWYAQEVRAPAPILSTYMGRGEPRAGRPFRFIRNKSAAIAANVYLLLYPTSLLAAAVRKDSSLLDRVWQWLNSVDAEALLGEGRVYGGGLYKLEPAELANLPADWLAREIGAVRETRYQGELFGGGG